MKRYQIDLIIVILFTLFVINGFLKQLIRNKAVLFTLNEDIPSDYLLSSIKESKAERKSGDFYSFKNNQTAIDFLDKK